MVGFYCATAFQIFLSVLIRYKYFRDKPAVMYIVSPLEIKEYNLQALSELGFQEILSVSKEEEKKDNDHSFEYVFFFTIFCANAEYLKGLKKEKLVLAYEGITTYQLKNWSMSDNLKRFDIETEIDEIWLPNLTLLLDKEYLPKCKEFNVAVVNDNNKEVQVICDKLNEVFNYTPCEITGSVIFMDRYLTKYLDVCPGVEYERMLVQNIYYGAEETPLIKRHPYDTYYETKYKNLENIKSIDNQVPWELIYLNNRIRKGNFPVKKYIIYNSFAPVNLTLLFCDNGFECVCVQPILDRYLRIKNTYLDSEITNQILSLFSEECQVKISFVDSLDEYWNAKNKSAFCTRDQLWSQIGDFEIIRKPSDLEIKAFRLQVDCALLSLKKTKGTYWMNADNSCADITRAILVKAIPDFMETKERATADIIVDCDGSIVDYTLDDFDIRDFRVIEGCGRLKKWEMDLEKFLRQKDHIYIWGVTKTNFKTFAFLEKVQLKSRVRKVFDSYATGICQEYAIVPFAQKELEENSYIMICANVAYPEIARNLIRLGYQEYIDFGPGVGESNVHI